mmetsp:Transcript_28418/g.25153  ORF Transcript_28418/g.25153 Transcript_28418/m.25153 type:complete len:82 (-) Transcript_28418:15-260(-)
MFDVYVYIMNDVEKFQYPSEEYLKGVAKTISSFYYFSGQEFDYENISIEIHSSKSSKLISKHKIKLSLSDYPDLIKDKLST